MNTANINISKVTITLSLINSNEAVNKDFDFVDFVLCVFYFRSVKFHYVKETHDINNLLNSIGENCSSISVQKPTKQIFVKIC